MQWNLACAQLASVHVEHHITAACVCGRWVGGWSDWWVEKVERGAGSR